MWEAWERIISYGFDRVGIQKSGKKNWTHVNGDQQQMIVQVIKMEQHGFIVHQTPNTDIKSFSLQSVLFSIRTQKTIFFKNSSEGKIRDVGVKFKPCDSSEL